MEENNARSEIDIIALMISVFKNWKSLLCFSGISGVIGLIVAFSTPKEYTAEVMLAPEMSSAGMGMSSSLSNMASAFGIDIEGKSSMDAIYPEIYPDIFASTDFIYSLFTVKVRLKDDNTERTYIDHLRTETIIPFWQYPMIWISQLKEKMEDAPKVESKGFVDPFRMSKRDLETCEGISNSIACDIDKKTSEITISVKDQDPMVAAIIADTLQHRLQDYIIDYRTKKARIDFDYYTKLMKEAEAKYNIQKSKYVGYSDSHLDPALTSVTTQEQNLKDKMGSAYSLYENMANMREQARAKIQEKTPSFTMIQGAHMPYKPSSRSKIMILFIFLVLGFICDTLYIFAKNNIIRKNN